MGLLENVLIAETFCRKDSTLGSALMFAGYASECLARHGDDQIRQKILSRVTSGSMIFTGAFLEAGGGYDLSRIQTSAVQNNGDWIINGTKMVVPFGATAGAMVVLCATETENGPGNSLIVVESTGTGITVSDAGEKLGGRLMPFANVSFENVSVPQHHMIGKPGDGARILEHFLCNTHLL